MIKKETRKYCWYTKGLNSLLSSQGYVHWATTLHTEEDFDEGSAYYFDSDDKTFGRCGYIERRKSG